MRTLLAALCTALFAASASAQQPTFADTLLDRFVGEWMLQGTIAGQQTTHDVSVEWVLAHQYLRIHEVSRALNTQGKPQYEATVFVAWDPPSRNYVCVWLDVYGGMSPQSIGRATRSGNELPFVFHEANGDTFRTTFAAGKTLDSWSWRMDAEDKTGTKPFARVTLTRKPPPVPTR